MPNSQLNANADLFREPNSNPLNRKGFVVFQEMNNGVWWCSWKSYALKHTAIRFGTPKWSFNHGQTTKRNACYVLDLSTNEVVWESRNDPYKYKD